MTASIGEIEHALAHAYLGWKRILSPEVAARRARWLHADLQAVGFDLQITLQKAVFDDETVVGVPSYQIPNSPYNVMNPTRAEERFHVSGSGMDCLDLLKLSRASEIGHTLLGDATWPKRYAHKLNDPELHPAAIEEVLWLKRWHKPTRIEPSKKLIPGRDADVDFRFGCDGLTINLEVKYRPRSWIARADGGYEDRDLSTMFSDIIHKFPDRLAPNELNLVALTVLCPLNEQFHARAEEFLNKQTVVSGLVVWCEQFEEGKTQGTVVAFHDLCQRLAPLFETDHEETCRIGVIGHGWRHPSERREMTFGESIQTILKYSAEQSD